MVDRESTGWTIEMKPTRTQRLILKRLAAGWIMDRAGSDGMGAYMIYGHGHLTMKLTGPTVSTLLRERWIETTFDDVSDYTVTSLGLEAAGIQPAEVQK